MTAIFKVPESDTLQGFQAGPADLLATISAGRSVWGWIGGLDGISSIFRFGRNLLITSKDFSPPSRLPASCQILAFDRIYSFEDTTSSPFNGDFNSQVVGLTICALSHELRLEPAIELFMQHLIPTLMGREQASFPGLREVLHTQLLDNGVKILNEGASRGLPDRFCKALETSSISLGRVERVVYWKGWKSELYMVGGLLRWIATGRQDSYLTRSALVARTALYMKEIGYTLGAIHTWNGLGKRPTTTRGVILVVGGASSVDHNVLSTGEYVLDDQGPLIFPKPVFISHYRFSTFGVLLIDTLQAIPEDSADCAEVFQGNLYKIHAELSENPTFTWNTSSEYSETPESGNEVWALPVWTKSNLRSSPNHPNAIRLSSIYFAEAAALLAPYYESIASPDIVRIASTQQDRDDRTLGLTSALVKF